MRVEALLTKLRKDRDAIDVAINALTPYVETPATAERIIKAVTPKRKTAEKPVHWLQTPEGRKKMSRISKRTWKKRKAQNGEAE